MNHLESSFTGKNSVWRYVAMFAAVLIVSNTIGALPLLVSYSVKAASDPSLITEMAANPNNFSALGFDSNTGLMMMLFPFIAGLFAFILLVKPLNNRTFRETINGTGTFRWNRFFISAFVWLILSAAYFIIYLKLDPSNFTLNNTSGTLILLTIISLVFIPFQAAFEEVLFRGYLMQGFTVIAKNRWVPLVMTSLLFGLMHAFNPEVDEFGFFTMMPQYVLFGLFFGIITILDDGIEAAIGAHAANNTFLCIVVTHSSSALQTQAVYEQHKVFPWAEFTALLISGIIFVIILKMIFKWKSYAFLFSRVERTETGDQPPYTEVLSSLR
jgi:hypothetical protein